MRRTLDRSEVRMGSPACRRSGSLGVGKLKISMERRWERRVLFGIHLKADFHKSGVNGAE